MQYEGGYNFRRPNLNAALGCAQLEQLPESRASKRRLFERYQESLAHIDELHLMEEPSGCESNYWLQTLVLSDAVPDQRDAILQATNDAGLLTRPAWRLMHQLASRHACQNAPLPVADSLEQRFINLPSIADLACVISSSPSVEGIAARALV